MATAKTGGNKKTAGLKFRMFEGKKVTPVLYNGRAAGHGKYFAGEVGSGNLVCDENGKPLKFNQIGTME